MGGAWGQLVLLGVGVLGCRGWCCAVRAGGGRGGWRHWAACNVWAITLSAYVLTALMVMAIL